MYPVVARHLAREGFRCWRDVSFLGAWIDLFGRSTESSVAIELKVSDWKRALRQAARVRNSADQAYVAIWAPYVHRALTLEAQRAFRYHGVGLLSVNGSVEIRVPSVRRTPRYPTAVVLPRRSTHAPA
jgi:hypothetical protein